MVEYTYDAWGKPLTKTGTLAATLGTLNPFRYRGYIYDEETGLYYLRSRYYNPVWGRFINADDPDLLGADELLEINPFCYCKNNPIVHLDNEGTFALLAIFGISAAVALVKAVVATAVAVVVATAVIVETVKNIEAVKTVVGAVFYKPHGKKGTTNPANLPKHQAGEKRKLMDQGGEKGDRRRKPNPNKRKPNKSVVIIPRERTYEEE